jgi:hypothetical protein
MRSQATRASHKPHESELACFYDVTRAGARETSRLHVKAGLSESSIVEIVPHKYLPEDLSTKYTYRALLWAQPFN